MCQILAAAVKHKTLSSHIPDTLQYRTLCAIEKNKVMKLE